MVKAAVIGKDGRTSAVTRTLQASPRITGAVHSLSTWSGKPRAVALAEVVKSTEEYRPDFVFVGPEDPLEAGVVDELEKRGIPCVGPGRVLAQLESSKAFTRDAAGPPRDSRQSGVSDLHGTSMAWSRI